MDSAQLREYIGEIRQSAGKIYYWMLSSVVHGHPAMDYENLLEHVTVRVFIEAPRYITHQIVRHRLASYAQESQRYTEARLVNLIKELAEKVGIECGSPGPDVGEAVAEEAARRLGEEELRSILGRHMGCVRADPATVLRAVAEYWRARGRGKPPQEAREILPQCIESQIYMTVNLRELLHIASQRLSARAQPEHARIWARIWRELWEGRRVPGAPRIPTAHLLLFKSPRTYTEATGAGLIHTVEDEEEIWREMTPEQRQYLASAVRGRRDIPDPVKNAVLMAAAGADGG